MMINFAEIRKSSGNLGQEWRPQHRFPLLIVWQCVICLFVFLMNQTLIERCLLNNLRVPAHFGRLAGHTIFGDAIDRLVAGDSPDLPSP